MTRDIKVTGLNAQTSTSVLKSSKCAVITPTVLTWTGLIPVLVRQGMLGTVPSAWTLTNVNLRLIMIVTKLPNVKTLKVAIHVNVQKVTLVMVSFAMTLMNVKLSNVRPMQNVSIYQLISNVSVKMDSVLLVNHVWTSMNVNLVQTTATKMPNVKIMTAVLNAFATKDTLVMAKYALMKMNVRLEIQSATKMPPA